jgi:hypothetical protein
MDIIVKRFRPLPRCWAVYVNGVLFGLYSRERAQSIAKMLKGAA